MLLNFELDRKMQHHHLEVMQRATATISRQIHDLLDAARIDNSNFAIEPHFQPVYPIVADTYSLFAARASARSVDFDFLFEPDLPHVRLDRYRIEQVLSNLIENALKVVCQGAGIRIDATRAQTDGHLMFVIRDTGPGISPRDVEHVFNRFWQGRGSQRNGAGLGLAICKGIVEAHGGRIWVESDVGVGTAFFFTLPVNGPAPPEPGPTPDTAGPPR
jgi:signal transduction histidine kinase